MAKLKHILLGRITKTHGFEGAVTVKVEKIFSENIPEPESVFLEIEGRPVPFFIEYSEQPDSVTLRLKFDGYDSSASVKEFVGSGVYLTGTVPQKSKGSHYSGLEGYIVKSSDGIVAGVVKELIENPSQLLLNIVTHSGKEFLIPLHEDLIEEVDNENRTIRMIIPEGLEEIN
jgi:16S rRNA processing protein RimM